jgi:hypothetical protein
VHYGFLQDVNLRISLHSNGTPNALCPTETLMTFLFSLSLDPSANRSIVISWIFLLTAIVVLAAAYETKFVGNAAKAFVEYIKIFEDDVLFPSSLCVGSKIIAGPELG